MSRKRFTEEFKVDAVRQITERGFAVRDLGERFTLIVANQIKGCFNLIVLY
jgi:transposase-like protein